MFDILQFTNITQQLSKINQKMFDISKFIKVCNNEKFAQRMFDILKLTD